MTTARRHEALIEAHTEQLAAVAAIVGDHNVKRLVMGENGVAAFYAQGPGILSQYGDVMTETERMRLKKWEQLDETTQDSVIAYAAGCLELEPQYLADVLHDDPDFHAALLHPVGSQPDATR